MCLVGNPSLLNSGYDAPQSLKLDTLAPSRSVSYCKVNIERIWRHDYRTHIDNLALRE